MSPACLGWGKVEIEVREVPVRITCVICKTDFEFSTHSNDTECPECNRRREWKKHCFSYRREEYIAMGGVICLYCGSYNIENVDSADSDQDGMWQKVQCHDCKNMWIDEFKLIKVREQDV
jgi:DNA-directed RNA polymerase subunit RPC12/RpoP